MLTVPVNVFAILVKVNLKIQNSAWKWQRKKICNLVICMLVKIRAFFLSDPTLLFRLGIFLLILMIHKMEHKYGIKIDRSAIHWWHCPVWKQQAWDFCLSEPGVLGQIGGRRRGSLRKEALDFLHTGAHGAQVTEGKRGEMLLQLCRSPTPGVTSISFISVFERTFTMTVYDFCNRKK